MSSDPAEPFRAAPFPSGGKQPHEPEPFPGERKKSFYRNPDQLYSLCHWELAEGLPVTRYGNKRPFGKLRVTKPKTQERGAGGEE
jgi:hypothetical protein